MAVSSDVMDDVALALGPRIDDLVEIAHDAGLSDATPRTIRYWVSLGYVSPPQQQARSWRYPNVAIGQVDTIARLRARGVHRDFDRFALFVEAGVGDPEDIRAFLLEYLRQWKQKLEEEHALMGSDPNALRERAAAAARMRGQQAPLPHRVRTTLDERTQAMLYTLTALVGLPGQSVEEGDGLHQLERLVGLRSGRGGATRDVSDLSLESSAWPTDPGRLLQAAGAADDDRLEFARRGIELTVVWFPALRSLFGSILGPAAGAALVDVIGDWEERITADVYALLFGAFLANGLERASDAEIVEVLPGFRPEVIAAMLLSAMPEADRGVAVQRLRPYQRLRLEHLLVRARASRRSLSPEN